MDKDLASPISENVLNEFYFYWDSHDFKNWVDDGLIPAELLDPSRVVELHNYIAKNRNALLGIPPDEFEEQKANSGE
jgi:hypothetical protein